MHSRLAMQIATTPTRERFRSVVGKIISIIRRNRCLIGKIMCLVNKIMCLVGKIIRGIGNRKSICAGSCRFMALGAMYIILIMSKIIGSILRFLPQKLRSKRIRSVTLPPDFIQNDSKTPFCKVKLTNIFTFFSTKVWGFGKNV